jgi:phosphoribosyl 1,2-cyclic phosphate phosphodiesterase
MKITYLGTAAAEGWPAVFCNCKYCKKARELGGKDIRTRSQTLINNDLLIDFPSDTYHHVLMNNIDLSAVKYCFITHSHMDHFEPMDVLYRMESCYSHEMTEPFMDMYGNEAVNEKFKRFFSLGEEELPAQAAMHEIELYETISVGDYKVTPLPAYHKLDEKAFIYLIQQQGKTLLYLHDTGIPYDEVYEYLQKNQIHADLISYDCTYAALPSGGGHMGLDSVPAVREALELIGVADENTIHVVNHFSHNGMLCHEELSKAAAEIGFLCSYDGFSLEF